MANLPNEDGLIHVERPIDINPDKPIGVERQNNIELNNEETFNLMKSYLVAKFSSIKRELNDSILKQAKKIKTSHKPTFKYKSNEKQYEFNNEIIKSLQEMMGDVHFRIRK